jgi:membrane-bound lytic murein transglycosylase D
LVPVLKPIFIQNGVPGELVWLAEVESSFNPRAKSPAGARGLFQFMPATAEEYGLRTRPIDQRLDPEKSADAASKYLRKLYGRFGDWPLAIAAYNAGGGRVNSTLRKHGGESFEDIASHLPRETRMYVPKVFAAMAVREGISPDALPPAR